MSKCLKATPSPTWWTCCQCQGWNLAERTACTTPGCGHRPCWAKAKEQPTESAAGVSHPSRAHRSNRG